MRGSSRRQPIPPYASASVRNGISHCTPDISISCVFCMFDAFLSFLPHRFPADIPQLVSTCCNFCEMRRKKPPTTNSVYHKCPRATRLYPSACDRGHATFFLSSPDGPSFSPARQSWQNCFRRRSLVMRRCENARAYSSQV